MDPRLAMCWNVLCELAADEQKYDEALRCAEMADKCPQNGGTVSRTETLRASIALETGDPAAAAQTYERLLKLYGRNAWPVALVWTKIALASAYDKMGRENDAERLLRETLATDPNIAPLVGEKLAVFLRHHKRAAEARAELEKVLPLADRSYLNGAQMVYYRLGLLDWEDKRYDIARVRLRRFLNTTVGQTDRELKRHRDFAIKVLGKMDAAPVSPTKP
jgi:tetratricopeptide (TPR) repeat protein